MIHILGKTHFRSTSGETSDKKSTQKNFYCTKRFVIEFQRESLELFLSYLVFFFNWIYLRASKWKTYCAVKSYLFTARLGVCKFYSVGIETGNEKQPEVDICECDDCGFVNCLIVDPMRRRSNEKLFYVLQSLYTFIRNLLMEMATNYFLPLSHRLSLNFA